MAISESDTATSGAPESPAAPSQTVEPGRPRDLWRRVVSLEEFGSLVALVLLVGSIAVFHPEFLGVDSLVNVGRQSTYFGIMALGVVFLLSMREIDLSIGSLYGLTITVAAFLMSQGVNPWVAAFLGILVGTAGGVFNGIVANGLRISTIIVTLGTLSMFKGLTLLISDSRPIADIPRDHAFFRWVGDDYLGIPFSLWLFFALTVVLSVLYRRTRFGYSVRAIGSNDAAAALGGIPIGRIRLLALALMGTLAGAAGMVTLAYFQSSDPNFGGGYELSAIAAAVIGGTTLSGGQGTVIGALFGALTIGTIRAGLIQFGLQPAWSTFTTGVIIIAAVALDQVVRRQTRVQF
jgi:ribose transport system permease protein